MYNYDDACPPTVALVPILDDSSFLAAPYSSLAFVLPLFRPAPSRHYLACLHHPPEHPSLPSSIPSCCYSLLGRRSTIQDDLQHLSRPFAVSQSSDPCLTCPFDPIVINPVLSPRTPRCPNGPPSPFFPQTPDCYLTHLCTPALRYSLVVPVPTISVAFSLVTQ